MGERVVINKGGQGSSRGHKRQKRADVSRNSIGVCQGLVAKAKIIWPKTPRKKM